MKRMSMQELKEQENLMRRRRILRRILYVISFFGFFGGLAVLSGAEQGSKDNTNPGLSVTAIIIGVILLAIAGGAIWLMNYLELFDDDD